MTHFVIDSLWFFHDTHSTDYENMETYTTFHALFKLSQYFILSKFNRTYHDFYLNSTWIQVAVIQLINSCRTNKVICIFKLSCSEHCVLTRNRRNNKGWTYKFLGVLLLHYLNSEYRKCLSDNDRIIKCAIWYQAYGISFIFLPWYVDEKIPHRQDFSNTL